MTELEGEIEKLREPKLGVEEDEPSRQSDDWRLVLTRAVAALGLCAVGIIVGLWLDS